MRLATRLSALAVAASAAACSTVPTKPLRDFNKLSADEQAEMFVCTIETLPKVPEPLINRTLQEVAKQDPSVAQVINDPVLGIAMRIATAAKISEGACADQLQIDPRTLPQMKMQIQGVPAPQQQRRPTGPGVSV